MALSPVKYRRDFFQKKNFMGDNLFGHKTSGEVILNWRTNDQIMQR